jgi:hypothetical protein
LRRHKQICRSASFRRDVPATERCPPAFGSCRLPALPDTCRRHYRLPYSDTAPAGVLCADSVARQRPSRAICVAGEDELLVCVRRTDPIRRISRTQTAPPRTAVRRPGPEPCRRPNDDPRRSEAPACRRSRMRRPGLISVVRPGTRLTRTRPCVVIGERRRLVARRPRSHATNGRPWTA